MPQRVFQHFSEIKRILLLRDPIHRAFSHFRHNQNIKPERTPQTFEEALLEEERIFPQAHQERLQNPFADFDDCIYSSYCVGKNSFQNNSFLLFKAKPILITLSRYMLSY